MYEVSRPNGKRITLRDLRTGDVLGIRERNFSRQARRDALVCAWALLYG